MNYNMQGMMKVIPKLFVMLKIDEGRNQEKHQVLMVNKTTSFKKKGKGKKKGNFKKNIKQVAAQERKPKSGPKPETECSYCKQTGHWKRNCPNYLADKTDGRLTKVYVIYMLLMCTLLELAVAPGYLILVLLLIFATRNRDYGLSGDWLRTRLRCAWEMVPKSMGPPSARYLYIYLRD